MFHHIWFVSTTTAGRIEERDRKVVQRPPPSQKQSITGILGPYKIMRSVRVFSRMPRCSIYIIPVPGQMKTLASVIEFSRTQRGGSSLHEPNPRDNRAARPPWPRLSNFLRPKIPGCGRQARNLHTQRREVHRNDPSPTGNGLNGP